MNFYYQQVVNLIKAAEESIKSLIECNQQTIMSCQKEIEKIEATNGATPRDKKSQSFGFEKQINSSEKEIETIKKEVIEAKQIIKNMLS